MQATTKTPSSISRADGPSTRGPSLSSSSSSSASTPPPIFLHIDERSFDHLFLTQHNFLHVYVGRVGCKLMALPLILHLHHSLLTVPAPLILSPLFSHLPSLIADVNVARLKNIKDKPKTVQTDQILFAFQFKETHPPYHIMVPFRQAASMLPYDGHIQHDALTVVLTGSTLCLQTVVNPRSALPKVSHPFIDSEADNSDEDEDGSEWMGDGGHLSDDEEEGGGDEEDEEDALPASDDEEPEGEGGSGTYRGGRYRAFHVSKHSLYVRAIARYEGGVRRADEKGGDGKEGIELDNGSNRHTSKQAAVKRKGSTGKSDPPAAVEAKVDTAIEDDEDYDFF